MSSRSISPATPESADDHLNDSAAILNDVDLSSWCHSFSPKTETVPISWNDHDITFLENGKLGDEGILTLDDITRGVAYDSMSMECGPPSSCSSDMQCIQSPVGQDSVAVSELLVSPSPSSPPQTKPVPPPAPRPRKRDFTISHKTVYPPKDACYDLQIVTPSIPQSGTKSRVETQVRVVVDLAHASSSICETGNYDKVGSWKWLKLPPGSSTRKRSRKEAKIAPLPADILQLGVEVTCASQPHMRATSCSSCQAREAKRIARKLAARVRPVCSDSDSLEDGKLPRQKRQNDHEDTSNIVTFNCPDTLSFSDGSVVLPLRITCYCRHHREKVGFKVHFTMTDHTGRVIGRGTTPPIMITDDHKSTGATSGATKQTSPLSYPFTSADMDPEAKPIITEDSSTKAPSKRRQSVKTGVVKAKQRAKPYDSGRSTKVSRNASASDLSSFPPTEFSALSPFSMSSLYSGTTAPSSPEVAEDIQGPPSNALNPFEGYDIFMSDPLRLDTVLQASSQASSPAYLPTAPPSPAAVLQPLSPALPSQSPLYAFFPPPQPPSDALVPPKIHRLIPSSGPTFGGVEITVLGSNFHSSIPLNCTFGDTVASSTLRWSDNTLVCVLPPRACAGVVAVGFEGMKDETDGSAPTLFTYTDESDKALMELALQVVGLKMTGKIEDAKNVAMRIVGNTSADMSPSDLGAGGAMQLSLSTDPLISRSLDPRRLLLSHTGDGDFENLIVAFLSLLDVDTDYNTPLDSASAISHQTSSGQTLLHLATMLKFPTLVAFLIEHDIDIDARDRNGCTALHFAAMARSTECAQLLIDGGADLDIVNVLGKTPEETAPRDFFDGLVETKSSRDVLDSFAVARDDDEDDEATWGDVEEESDDEQVIRFKPRSRARRSARSATSAPLFEDEAKDVGSSAAGPDKEVVDMVDEKQAAASIVDLIQRTLAQWPYQGIIPNIPHLPYMPQIPQLPGMPAVPWVALQQVPLVFPVFVPMPAWPAFLGEKLLNRHDPTVESTEGEKLRHVGGPQPVEGDVRAGKMASELWMRMASIAGRPIDGPAPPPYTSSAVPGPVAELEPQPSTASAPQPQRPLLRRFGYGSVQVTDQEIKAYGYRPTQKQSQRLLKKQDLMLVLFWIPILFLSLLWALYTVFPIAFRTVKTLLPLKTSRPFKL